jgi:hypothetical protein
MVMLVLALVNYRNDGIDMLGVGVSSDKEYVNELQ